MATWEFALGCSFDGGMVPRICEDNDTWRISGFGRRRYLDTSVLESCGLQCTLCASVGLDLDKHTILVCILAVYYCMTWSLFPAG